MKKSMWGTADTQHFYSLSPDAILNTVEDLGLRPTGRLIALNSMENRVHDIEIDPFKYQDIEIYHVITKFYRPGRWNKEQILEEHQFLHDLTQLEIEVNAPIDINGETIFKMKDSDVLVSLFKKIGGRSEVELNDDHVQKLGRLLGRVHLTGRSKDAPNRLKIDVATYGYASLSIIQADKSLPSEHIKHYEAQCNEIFKKIEPLFEGIATQRLHGDCHLGNVLWSHENRPLLVDFDDMVVGPVIQDFWLLFDWNDFAKRDIFIDAYEEFSEFPYQQIKLIEALRSLRMIHFNAWISKRYEDPSFQHAFAHFKREEFWSTQIADLRHQLMLLENQSSSIF